MNIITVTVNPAVDLHLECDGFKAGSYHTASRVRRDSAGKGVNVSRALSANGISNLCYIVLGEDGAEDYLMPLRASLDELDFTYVEGRVRENVNIQHGDSESVIASPGPAVDRAAVEEMKAALLPRIDSDTVLVFSGSIAHGSDKGAILGFLFDVRARGGRLVIDSKAFSLEEIIPLSPLLIKPNEEEAEALTGLSVSSLSDAASVAETIRSYGCENVLLTLGAHGAALASPDGIFGAPSPRIEVRSTVGAGDSTVAGFLAALSLGESGKDLLARAMSYGSAACEEEGSMPPREERVKELLALILPKVTKL